MFDEAQLRDLSPGDLNALEHRLSVLAAQSQSRHRRTGAIYERRRSIALAAILICCVVLAGWTGLLAETLPFHYQSGGWRGAWVGFDIALLAAFSVTGWAAWRRRHILIVCLVVLATLLCCDAWFDVSLDAGTPGIWNSVLTAVVVELPLAALAVLGARRLLRLTIEAVGRRHGYRGPVPALWRIPLLGGTGSAYLRDLLPRRSEAARERTTGAWGADRADATRST
jgi:hypothetical protein